MSKRKGTEKGARSDTTPTQKHAPACRRDDRYVGKLVARKYSEPTHRGWFCVMRLGQATENSS